MPFATALTATEITGFITHILGRKDAGKLRDQDVVEADNGTFYACYQGETWIFVPHGEDAPREATAKDIFDHRLPALPEDEPDVPFAFVTVFDHCVKFRATIPGQSSDHFGSDPVGESTPDAVAKATIDRLTLSHPGLIAEVRDERE